MYLRGFAATIEMERPACAPGTYAKAFYNDGPKDLYGVPVTVKHYECVPLPGYAPAAQGTQITVSVPTQTTVSPQVSPQFIQQQQPTNSPIGAELVGPREGADAQALAETERERQAELLDAMRRMSAQPQSVIIPNTTSSGDGVRADQSALQDFQSAGLPLLPALLIAGAAVGLIALRKSGRTRKRK